MNRQDSNNPLALRLTLLVLAILALAIYLHFNTAQPENVSGAVSPGGLAVISAAPRIAQEITTPAAPDPQETAPVIAEIPIGLDPEAARVAVHKVENGVYERATKMFEQEPIDVGWAASYEQSLRDMFALHQGLQRVSINSISCHTSMCRIEVFTPRDADADFFTAMFYDGLATFRAGALKAEAAITRRMEQGMTSVYVARKDHTLGFY